MKSILLALSIGLGWVAATSVSQAKFVTETDAAMAVRLDRSMERVLNTLKIDAEDARIARHTALGWFLIGPCEAKNPRPEIQSSVSGVVSGNDRDPHTAATYALIGLLFRETILGRKPGEGLCQIVDQLVTPTR